MVIVRESPRAKEPKDQPQWPPRSPHEAAMSSPSGRKRLQRIRDGRSPSPSPKRANKTTPKKAMSITSTTSEEDEDEDEETLQLKLKAIEAKLKLKKLQQKAKKSKDTERGDVDSRAPSAAGARSGRSSALEPPETFEPEVQVPLSPRRKETQPIEPKSPARTLLGIDKGLKAQDVSLKRPRSVMLESGLSRTGSTRLTREEPKIKSFSERMAESRVAAHEQQTREERIQSSRSTGFGLEKSVDITSSSRPSSRVQESARSASRTDTSTPTTAGARKDASIRRTGSVKERLAAPVRPTAAAGSKHHENKGAETGATSRPYSRADGASEKTTDRLDPSAELGAEAAATLESYSGLHLDRRLIDHNSLTRTFQGKELYPIPRLLHEVKGPHYEPPDCESDYVVLGVICSKSTPRDHKNNPRSIDTAGSDEHAKPKFMVFRLTDFKYEIDLFLFDTGFERWWKLKEGTLVAVLNPGIMPPKRKDTDAFSLKVTSSEDTVLEIGHSRDLGFCKSIKADGHQCTAWIDKRRTEVCEYHISLQVDKARADRMQFGTMTGGPGAGRGGGSGRGRGGSFGRGRGRGGPNGLRVEGKMHDAYLHETMWLTPKEMGLNTASMLDKEYSNKLLSDEQKRQRKRDKEKEADLARSLGLKGNGTGSEYLKHRATMKDAKDRRPTTTASNFSSQTTSTTAFTAGSLEPPDAASLGLLGKTAQQVSLSPVKRKLGSSTGSSSTPMGWGGAFKRGLLEPKDPPPEPSNPASSKPTFTRPSMSPRKSSMKNTQEDGSPRKKARLLLEGKGVRLPGRESLGMTPGDIFLDDDDDDLEIV